MAIKITSFLPQEEKANIIEEPLCLQDNGVYWYLYPHFLTLHKRTGEMIDLYGIARFAGDALLELDGTLAELIKTTSSQPNEWDQLVGKVIKPGDRVLYERVVKSKVLDIINLLENITNEGIKNNAVIVFEGL